MAVLFSIYQTDSWFCWVFRDLFCLCSKGPFFLMLVNFLVSWSINPEDDILISCLLTLIPSLCDILSLLFVDSLSLSLSRILGNPVSLHMLMIFLCKSSLSHSDSSQSVELLSLSLCVKCQGKT